MSACERLESGAVELHFYSELDAHEQSIMERHIDSCAECRHALDELAVIRDALATVPVVEAPAGGDWTGFMGRLDGAIRSEDRSGTAEVVAFQPRPRPAAMQFRLVPYFAAAALLALVAMSVAYVAMTTRPRSGVTVATAPPSELPAATPVRASDDGSSKEALAKLSEQHFERSKLVVLGLANKDPKRARQADWEYERQLASHLLDDTRLYRMAAEEKGMKTLAGVMGDLELVLLQTSLAGETASQDLEQIQRLIHKRDLLGKMEVVSGI
jgi:hypothetical protein